MPAIPFIIAGAAVVGAGAMVVGTIESNKNAKKAAAASAQQAAAQRQQTQLQAMRQRLDAVRTGRQALGHVQQAAENQGVATSSAAQGGQGSVVSQMTSNLSFLDQYNTLTDQAETAAGRAMHYQNKANMWNSIESAGAQVASMAANHL